MGFQIDAFQNDAFQIGPGVSGANKKPKFKRVWLREAKKQLKEYNKAVEVLNEVDSPLDKKRLESITSLYQEGQDLKVNELQYLLANELARKKFYEVLTSVQKLEDDMMIVLALALALNEAL